MSVDLETFPLCQFFGSGVFCYCLEEAVNQIVVVFAVMIRFECHVLEPGQSQHGGHCGVAPTVKSRNGSQFKVIVLEPFLDSQWKCALDIQRNSYQVLLALLDGGLQWALWCLGSSLPVRNQTVAVPHEDKCPEKVKSVECSHLGTDTSIQK